MQRIYREIGQKIRTLRNKRKLTQEDLAEMIKMDARSVIAIETGQRNPTLKTLYRICRALKIKSSVLLPF